jgi:hypothetical protein
VLEQSANPGAEAALPLQQAAAYYPRQADTLTDMLDPYQMRTFLRKSREGNYILQHYRSTMLGAGYFSPDLQLATQAFARGDRTTAETKLFDHFYRRRLQQQWDFILADIEYCYQHLGTPFLQVFPESSYLDLVANPTTFGKKLALAVRNRSDRDLHNASLILCLHLTDMLPGDYVALQTGPTLPLLKANTVTPVGELQISVPFNGTTKTIQDIVATRAILVAQEVVTWVDTPQYRLAELQQQRQREGPRPALPSLDLPWLTQLRQQPGQFAQGLLKDVQLRPLDKRWGKDGVEIVLPRELALLRPFFRLAVNGQQLEPKENIMADSAIHLTFDDVAELTGQPPERLKLLLQSPFTDLALEWLLGKDRQYRLDQVQVPEPAAPSR